MLQIVGDSARGLKIPLGTPSTPDANYTRERPSTPVRKWHDSATASLARRTAIRNRTQVHKRADVKHFQTDPAENGVLVDTKLKLDIRTWLSLS